MGVRRAIVVISGALAVAVGCGRLVNDGESAPTAVAEAGADDSSARNTDAAALLAADFCDGATFCDGFERPASDVQGPWDVPPYAADGGSVTITTERAVEGRSALRISLSPDDGMSAAIKKRSLPKGSRIRVSFSMFIPSMPQRLVNIGLLNFDANSVSWGVFLILDDQGLHVDETRIPYGQPATYVQDRGTIAPVPTGHWVPVVIDLTLSNPGRLTASLDGKPVAQGLTLTEGYPFEALSGVVVGSEYAAAGAATTVIDFDDVRIDVVP